MSMRAVASMIVVAAGSAAALGQASFLPGGYAENFNSMGTASTTRATG